MTGFLFLLIFVPLSMVIGFLGLLKKGHGYWITTLTIFTILSAVAAFVIIKDYILYRKDKSKQRKYVGTITVINKSSKKGDNLIFTDCTEVNKIDLYISELFDKISIGDELTIEISQFSKTLFRLKKNNIDLLNGH